MTCNSCGSEYDERMAQCPYCGSENEAFARKEQRDYILSYEKKIDELDSVPRQMAKKAANKVIKIIAVIVALFLILAGIVWLITRREASQALERQQSKLAKLEEYYQSGDYAAIGDYLQEIDDYGSSYRKYEQIEQVYYRYENILKSAKLHKELLGQYFLSMPEEKLVSDYFVWDLKDCFRQLRMIREIEEDDFPYGNEEGICDIRDKYIEILKTELLLTEEEIEDGTVRYVDSDTDYTDLAVTSVQRMTKELKESYRAVGYTELAEIAKLLEEDL